jgi:hypothetical protein
LGKTGVLARVEAEELAAARMRRSERANVFI